MAFFNLNKVILGGRLTAAPELKTTTNGTLVTSFSIAVNRKYTKDQAQPQSDFINCVAWKNTAEFISKYFNKGSSICVEGNLQTRVYDDNKGNKKYVTEVIVEQAYFVDSKSENVDIDKEEAPIEFEVIGADQELPF